jgi:hypothetical protein
MYVLLAPAAELGIAASDVKAPKKTFISKAVQQNPL